MSPDPSFEAPRPEPSAAPRPAGPEPLPARIRDGPNSRRPQGQRLGLYALACFAAGLGSAVVFKDDIQRALMAPQPTTRTSVRPAPVPAMPRAQSAPAPAQSSPLPFLSDAEPVAAAGLRQKVDTAELAPLALTPTCPGGPEAVAPLPGSVDIAGLPDSRVVGRMDFAGRYQDSFIYRIRNPSSVRIQTTVGNVKGESWRVDLPPGATMSIKSAHYLPDSPLYAVP